MGAPLLPTGERTTSGSIVVPVRDYSTAALKFEVNLVGRELRVVSISRARNASRSTGISFREFIQMPGISAAEKLIYNLSRHVANPPRTPLTDG